MAGLIEILVPDIGDYSDVPVVEILVKPGDAVAKDDPIVTLESDKATMDIPSPQSGIVGELRVGLGDKVSEGSVLATLSTGGAEPGPQTATEATSSEPQAAESSEIAPPPPVAAAAEAAGSSPPYASPAVRKAARERGIDLSGISGTGLKGRITKADLDAPRATAGASGNNGQALDLLPWPKVDFAKFGGVERVPLSRIQKISGANLHRNWVVIPHVTHNDEADVTDLEAFRKQINAEHAKSGVKVTMVALLIAAVSASLKRFPQFNSSLDGDELVLKSYVNVGFAADTPNGLVVPVIKNADQKGLLALASELTELSGKARDGKLMPGDMAGGTFTISSLGGIGGTSFTPIVNAPEVAILGATRSAIRPVWDGSAFQPRLMVPLSLSYDHRVIDGAAAARFSADLAGSLSDMRRVLL